MALSEAAVKGRAIYDEKIRAIVEADPAQKGRVVVIDVRSGEYEIADTDAEATLRLIERCPDAFTWAERVGHPKLVYKAVGLRVR